MSIKIEESVDMDLIIQKALRGYPVKLHNGLKAYVRYKEEELNNTLVGVVLLLEGADIIYWKSDGKCPLSSEYDIIGLWKEPLEFKYWTLLGDVIKYVAKDSYGDWWGFTVKPTKDIARGRWTPHGHVWSLRGLKHSVFPKCHWEDSLIERSE